MTSRSRLLVLLVSTPLIVFVVVGGVLGRVDGAAGQLRAAQDVRRGRQPHRQQLRRAGRTRQHHARRDARARRRPRRRQRLAVDGGNGRREQAGRRAEGIGRHRADPPVLPPRRLDPRWLAGREGRPPHRRLRARHRRQADARDVGLGRHAHAARRAGHQGQAHGASRQRHRAARRRARARGRGGARGHGEDRQAGRRPGARPGVQRPHRVGSEVADCRSQEGRRDVAHRRSARHRGGQPRARDRAGAPVRRGRRAGQQGEQGRAQAGRDGRRRRRQRHACRSRCS